MDWWCQINNEDILIEFDLTRIPGMIQIELWRIAQIFSPGELSEIISCRAL